ncbi:Phage/plasmid primase, P4 family, C-terminal domain (fragment) [Hyella patelloides LEGE 07179]|uniref:Phage/plasmid primase, P4 family, C-terminal domain n=1 Tax=Hyella patelloides LEGE 07179 TaxID=945734 RepID=A0A563VZL3_9CYAN
MNEWVIQDSTGCVPIGSNAHEWKIAEDYDATCSTLYGSYTLYCQQTKRSAKSPQNFSAELLELTNRTLGWSTEKARVKIAGKTVRVIKGLKLRSPYDNEPTYEEILQGDNQGDRGGDNQGDNQGDNLKPPSNKESDNGDNPFENKTETEKNFSHYCDNPTTVTREESHKNLQLVGATDPVTLEVSNKNASNKSSLAPAPVTIPTQQRVEAVPPVVTQVVTTPVTQVVTPQINWKTYPYNSSDSTTLENRSLKVKERILNCSTSNDLIKLLANNKVSQPEINWLRENYLTIGEKAHLELIRKSTQGNLLNQSNLLLHQFRCREAP